MVQVSRNLDLVSRLLLVDGDDVGLVGWPDACPMNGLAADDGREANLPRFVD